MTKMQALVLSLFLLIAPPTTTQATQAAPAKAPAAPASLDPEAARILADVKALSSEKYHGRRAGTADADAAAAYVVDAFRKIGLLPGGTAGSYLQSFEFVDGVDLGPGNALQTATAPVGRRWASGTDFRPLAFSNAGNVASDVVFAGYGIASKDLGYDDYAGLDVKGKVVLVLRYGPDGDDQDSRFYPYTALRRKTATAKDKGAAALLVVTGPLSKQGTDELVALRTDSSFANAGIVAFTVRRAVADALFVESKTSLEAAQKAIDETKKPLPVALKSRVELTADVKARHAKTANVLGLLPGSDPSLNTEALVIGAHYDHLGLGGSSSLEGASAIHPGADDNASGVAAVLELARTLAPLRGTLKRSVLFIAFGAEEEGTLGSLHYVKEPTLAVVKIVAMLNLDMVGRLREDTVEVHGAGTSPAWKPLLTSANAETKLVLKLREGGYGPSDHSSFYAAGKPVLFFFTGTHADYHRASDTADKLNAPGEERIVRLVANVAQGILGAAARPELTVVANEPKVQDSPSGALRAWVGTIPDYSEEKGGLKLSGVSPGSPAEKVGLKRGDVIVKLGDKEISSIYDYMYALQERKPGEHVTLVVNRPENGATKSMTIELTLGTRPGGSR